MQVPDHIVQSAKQELNDTIQKLSMEILDKLRDDTDGPLIALCVIQATHFALLNLVIKKCDPSISNNDFKVSSCEFTQLYLGVVEPRMSTHMLGIARSYVIAGKLDKSSEQN
jgi:hypothetical protein